MASRPDSPDASLFLPVGDVPEACWRPSRHLPHRQRLARQVRAGGRATGGTDVSVGGSVLTVRGTPRLLRQRPVNVTRWRSPTATERGGTAVRPRPAHISTEYDHGMLIVHIETEGEADHDD
jgi:hypothetical protein